MGEPNTGGQLKTKIADMQVGDYIKCQFYIPTSGQLGMFYNWASSTVIGEMPNAGAAVGGNYEFYFIKVEKGLLISDRVLQHSISWDTLNSAEAIQGKLLEKAFGDKTYPLVANGIIRSLGGGNSYADANGNSSTTDAGLGAWPENEWDTYIVKKDYGTGAGRDDVWHWMNVGTRCQETNHLGYGDSTNRVRRGSTSVDRLMGGPSYDVSNADGFRPVFQYQEVTP